MSNGKVDAKIVVLGKEFCGKTSLVERCLHDRFSGHLPYQNTIGAAYGSKKLQVFGQSVLLGIWDTAGSERYEAMSRIYYRGAWAALLCYDLTDNSTWLRVRFWTTELKHNEPNARIYFVGTKKDIIDRDPQARQVDANSVAMLAAELDNAAVLETSSKTGEGVIELFDRIAKDFVKYDTPVQAQQSTQPQGMYLEASKDQHKGHCRNC